jgi:hypothetical protein
MPGIMPGTGISGVRSDALTSSVSLFGTLAAFLGIF